MGEPPEPNALAVGAVAEVVAVLRFGQPAGLPRGFGCLAAVILWAVLLVPAVAGIGVEFFLTAQAFAGGGGTHQRAQNAPPTIRSEQRIGKKSLRALPPRRRAGRRRRKKSFE